MRYRADRKRGAWRDRQNASEAERWKPQGERGTLEPAKVCLHRKGATRKPSATSERQGCLDNDPQRLPKREQGNGRIEPSVTESR
jgi:hypothetical protein